MPSGTASRAPAQMTAWILPRSMRPSRDGPAGPFVDLLAMSILALALLPAAWALTALPGPGEGPSPDRWAGWAEASAAPMPAWLAWWTVQGLLCLCRGLRTGRGASHAYATALACGAVGLPATAAVIALSPGGEASMGVAAVLAGMAVMPLTLGVFFPFLLVAAAPLAAAAAARSRPWIREAAWWGSAAVSAVVLWPAVGILGWFLILA